jgi:geranylgeranyl pyrophosphate synthase
VKEKFTLPCIHYLCHCGPEEILEFQELLSNPNGSTNNILFDRLTQTDSIDYAYKQACSYSRVAQESLSVLHQTDLREGLIRLAQSVVSSSRQGIA